jgi:hypothetical protein
MGKITQYIAYLNVKKHPNKEQRVIHYSHITIGDKEKTVRKEYRKKLKAENKQVIGQNPGTQ